MTNSRILFDYVALVRRLLEASNDADVANVGRLGEITYLVDEHITQVDLQLLDSLIASTSSKDRRAFATRRLQQHRDALQPYVGRHLLKTGMQCASRLYEIHIDPVTESIAHLTGFDRPETPPADLVDAAPAERVRWIFDHPGHGTRDDGRRVVEILLAGRTASELSDEELLLLGKGYNWWGQNAKAFETAKLALARMPRNTEWLSLARLYARNAYLQNLPRYLTACDTCIAEGLGPAAFWHLAMADQYIDFATGESELEDYEWMPGHRILHPEILRPAAEAIEAALACEPRLRDRETNLDWVGDWNVRFAAVLQASEYAHLSR